MKLFSPMLIASMLFASSAIAEWIPIPRPMACNLTSEAFSEMSAEKSQPILMSKLENIQVIIWINPKDEITVTNTMMINDKSITCIVAAGDSDTTFIERTNKPTY